jgi:hypothetical protein
MAILEWAIAAAMAGAACPPTDVAGIMARVAANQENARDARRNYIYRQEQTIRLRRPGGKLAREQQAEYIVTPGKQGAEKQRTKFEGKYALKGKYLTYDTPDFRNRGIDIDGELINSMAEDMMNDQKSRDGIARDLFPLTSDEQKHYEFRLAGKEEYHGQAVYRVAFQPRRGAPRGEEDDPLWKGEALIDAREYQPVSVVTSLADKIPLAVKILLGTDIKGLGFSVTYQKFADGVWFPVSYGGEFALRGVFFYRRNISVAMQNSDFRKTDVQSTLVYAADAH